jgi:hypothetical protein
MIRKSGTRLLRENHAQAFDPGHVFLPISRIHLIGTCGWPIST